MKATLPDNEARRLAALAAYRILDTPPEQEFDDIAEFAAELFHTPIALISFVDGTRAWFKATVGLSDNEAPREIAFCAQALGGDEVLLVPDAAQDARFADNPLVIGGPKLRFYAGTPLTDPEGHALGTLCVLDLVPRTLDERQQRVLRFLGQQVMTRLLLRRRLAEQSLAQAEVRRLAGRLTTTLESLTDGFFTLDRDWCFTYANREVERVLRRPRLELLGQHIWTLFPEAQGTVSQREYERALRENVPVQFETFYEPLESWFDVRAFPSEQGLSVYFHDITVARRAQEALRNSEERLRLVTRATNDAVWDWDLAADLVWWNEGYDTLFGRRRDAVSASSKSWTEFIHAEDLSRIVDSIHAVIGGTESDWSAEYRFLRADGSYVHVSGRGHVIRDAQGRAVRMVGGMTDLTERKRAEEKMREQAALLDKAQDAILVRDLEHRILYWNRSAERLYGWTAKEAQGRSIQELLYRDSTSFLIATAATIEHGEWVGEIELVSKTGRKLNIEGRWTLVRDDAGRPRSILAISTDITEKKKLEQQFLRAQRLESIGTLAGGIAHDLNNVLAPILMSIDLLKMGIAEDERLAVLDTIESSARRGADMVGQVLSFARGVSGRQIEIQARHLVNDIVKIVNETFSKDIRVETSLPHDLWTLVGDPTQLHQVLLNLCINARDAMPRGGTLSLSAENKLLDEHYAGLEADARPGPHVMLQIEDSGTGIPPEIVEKIFDPFFTTKEPGKGTGLGLSTSLAIIKSHGGFIRVYSEPGKGTRFRIYLPATAKQATSEAVAAPELPRGHGELVLVVDDEASVRQITRQTLEAFGYRVLLASDGAEAVAIYAVEKERVAVVLTDMMMPVMDGPATIQVLMRMNPKVRIVAASGLNANGRVAKAASAGARHFLPKPYTAEALLTTLRTVLQETV